MKTRILIAGIAALFLATGAAHAEQSITSICRQDCEEHAPGGTAQEIRTCHKECRERELEKLYRRNRPTDCDEDVQDTKCDNPYGWIAQCSKGDKSACKASNDLLAQAAKDDESSFEDNWHALKWECGFEWGHPDQPATIYREDIPKILKAFKDKDMRAHCAWLQCLEDRTAGKVKHCYYNEAKQCNAPEWNTAKDKSGNKVMYFRYFPERCEK
jgi:hypothetical protein